MPDRGKSGSYAKYSVTMDAIFTFGSHQKWCEMLHKNVLSCVVHAISDVIHKFKIHNSKYNGLRQSEAALFV